MIGINIRICNCIFALILIGKVKSFFKIFLVVIVFSVNGKNSIAQELVSKDTFEPIEYSFTGKNNYKTKKTLTHALAYSYSKDVGEIKAKVSYPAQFKTLKIQDKGFETIVRLGPEIISGHTELLDFDFSKIVLPKLKSISLFIYKGDELIYVKNIADFNTNGKSLYFSFKHQRYTKHWRIELKKPVWEFEYDELEFNKAWEHIANYQLATEWLKEIKLYSSNSNTEEYITKTRYLELLTSIKNLEFYHFTKNKLKQDPRKLHRQLEICLYKFKKDIEILKNQKEDISTDDFTQIYFAFERNILNLHNNNNPLYGDIYHAFNPDDYHYFIPQLIEEMLICSERKTFEKLYQKYALELINELNNNKQTSEALFQINRFESFYKNSDFLYESNTFKHFKARAVYDIYLSYIQVSKQALEHDQIDMAIRYLDKASDIQKKYPSEIINNILVEKEMRNLIKKAMSRYQILLNQGKTDSAKKVKKGIIGLMKKLGLESNIYPIG